MVTVGATDVMRVARAGRVARVARAARAARVARAARAARICAARAVACAAIALCSLACQAHSADEAGAALAILAQPSVETFYTFPDPREPRARRRAALEAALAVVDSAAHELWLWCYGLDEPELIGALGRARDRGVTVRIFGSKDQSYERVRAAGFRPELRARSGLQHVKALLNDSGALLTGTGNFTTSGFGRNHNVFVRVALAPGELTLFRDLLERESVLPESLPDLHPGIRMLVSPVLGRSIQARIVQAILEARHSIRFLMFAHTDPVISAAIALRAAEGIFIEGIYDDRGEQGVLVGEPLALNASLGSSPAMLYLDGNRYGIAGSDGWLSGGKLHHKTLIIDEQRVLTGSYNWSLGARDDNLELLLDITLPAVARSMLEEFERIRARASVVGRSPVRVAPGGQFNGTTFCSEDSERATFFGGAGAYFQALHFPAARGCRSLADAGRGSAGIQGPPVALQTWHGLVDLRERLSAPAISGYGLRTESPPCARGECRAAILRYADPGRGLLVIGEDIEIVSYESLGANGLRPGGGLQPLGAGTWQIDGWTGDRLFFVRSRSGLQYVLCAQQGATLAPALRGWLGAALARFGSRPPCFRG